MVETRGVLEYAKIVLSSEMNGKKLVATDRGAFLALATKTLLVAMSLARSVEKSMCEENRCWKDETR